VRVIIYGAGAVGGVIGAKLYQHDYDVTFIARGANFTALQKNGILLETPVESVRLKVPVVEQPSELTFGSQDVVILTVKSQDTSAALRSLSSVAPVTTAVVCGQNGVENERVAMRHFRDIFGMCVMLPATHLTPGIVQVYSAPVSGLLDVGRWPQGSDARIAELAEALTFSSFESLVRDDIARWKWGKLMMNLGNAVEAVCGPMARPGILWQQAVTEGKAVLDAAGIAYVEEDEDSKRRGQIMNYRSINGVDRGGGSSWQSLARSTGSIETDYLTGEIVLQGRLHDVATPVNELLQRLANQLAAQRRAPGAWSENEVISMLRET
jgi:2-dehydropantoate 2-reductase